ncbi:MAG: DUF853 family protein [Chloroflexi bacterium]|nr:DUF853 family protein [Chloroflexota bacterium]
MDKDPLTYETLLATALFPSAIVIPFQASPGRNQLILGFQQGDKPVGVSEEALNRHIVVAGATGVGKTNWLNFFASQLLGVGKTAIWLDLKNEARHLVRAFPDLWVFPMEDFRWNPLEVPAGVRPKQSRGEWI